MKKELLLMEKDLKPGDELSRKEIMRIFLDIDKLDSSMHGSMFPQEIGLKILSIQMDIDYVKYKIYSKMKKFQV